MKEIVVGVIKLIVLHIVLNIVINLIKYFIQFETTELIACIIFLVRNIVIIYVGVKFFWKDLDSETVKKIALVFMILLIAYRVIYVVNAITEYEEALAIDFSNKGIQYDETLTEREREQLEDVMETLTKAGQNVQIYLEEGREEYYIQLLRTYIVAFSIIAIGLYGFVAPKWFEKEKEKEQKNPTFDFYKK